MMAEPASEIDTFVGELGACFERARARSGFERVRAEIAGVPVAIDFASAPVKRALTPMLAAVTTDHEVEPELVIRVWDSATSSIEPPAPPLDAAARRGYAAAGPGGRIRLAFSAVSSTLQVYERGAPVAHYWVRDPAGIASWEAAAPFRTLLSWWLESRGSLLLHAAVVGTAERAVVITGRSGAGKSTSALAAVRAGLRYLGDDCAALGFEATPVVHALYTSGKVDRALLGGPLSSLQRFDTRLQHDRGKAILNLRATDAPPLERAGIGALLAQRRRAGERSRLSRISPAEALASLGPSTLLQNPGAGQASLDRLALLTREVPTYALEAGTDLTHVAEVLAELVA